MKFDALILFSIIKHFTIFFRRRLKRELNNDICKLLVLDYLTKVISKELADECRPLMDISEETILPSNYPTIEQIMDFASNSSNSRSNKRQLESTKEKNELTPILTKKLLRSSSSENMSEQVETNKAVLP